VNSIDDSAVVQSKGNDGSVAAIRVEDFTSLLCAMNRLIVLVGQLAPLKSAKLGIADWLILSNLSSETPIRAKRLAKTLGISEQRVVQAADTFAQAGLTAPDQSDADAGILLTPEGKARVDAVNAEVQGLLAAALQGREKILVSANKSITILSRISESK